MRKNSITCAGEARGQGGRRVPHGKAQRLTNLGIGLLAGLMGLPFLEQLEKPVEGDDPTALPPRRPSSRPGKISAARVGRVADLLQQALELSYRDRARTIRVVQREEVAQRAQLLLRACRVRRHCAVVVHRLALCFGPMGFRPDGMLEQFEIRFC